MRKTRTFVGKSFQTVEKVTEEAQTHEKKSFALVGEDQTTRNSAAISYEISDCKSSPKFDSAIVAHCDASVRRGLDNNVSASDLISTYDMM